MCDVTVWGERRSIMSRTLALAAGMFLIASCKPTPAMPPETERAPHFQERLYHVLVVSNLPVALGSEWATGFHRQLDYALRIERVSQATEYWRFMPTGEVQFQSLRERDEMVKRIESFQPETVLMIFAVPNAVHQTQWGQRRVNVITLMLFTPDDEELVWFFGYAFDPGGRPSDVAAQVTQYMQRDGLIRGAPPPSPQQEPPR